jgi:hypothetical protein
MKFRIMMKSPDAVDYAVKEAVQDELVSRGHFSEDGGEVDEDVTCEAEEIEEEIYAVLDHWFRYRECVDLEIDTETGTCKPVHMGGSDGSPQVVLDRARYESLIKDESMLNRLYASGVDNWDGYSGCQDDEQEVGE